MVKARDDVFAIVLARGGSKGIPRKNVMDVLGRPLIEWTIQQVTGTGIEQIFVSTDDAEIASVSKECGSGVIWRPDSLATDSSKGDDAVIHAIDFLNLAEDAIILMPQVTSPIRTSNHLEDLIGLISSKDFDSAFTAVQIDDICVWAMQEPPKSVTYDYESRAMRQERAPMVVENGSAYCSRVKGLRKFRNRLNGRIGVSLMPKWTLFEIDDPQDVEICEAMMTTFLPNSNSTPTLEHRTF